MSGNTCISILLLSVLLSTLLSEIYAIQTRSYQSSLDDLERQDIINLAARLLKVAFSSTGGYLASEKRNAGTIDALYNLPHLLNKGRRY